jgi:hypothetical protein
VSPIGASSGGLRNRAGSSNALTRLRVRSSVAVVAGPLEGLAESEQYRQEHGGEHQGDQHNAHFWLHAGKRLGTAGGSPLRSLCSGLPEAIENWLLPG